MEKPSQVSAEMDITLQAAAMFLSLPDFPRVEVWRQDRLNRLTATATAESCQAGSAARARYVLRRYNTTAAAFKQLVATDDLQNAFITLLCHFEREAWFEFIGGIPIEIRDGTPSIAPGLARRKRWWIRQGYKQLASLRQERMAESELPYPLPRSGAPSERLDIPERTAATPTGDKKAPGLNVALIKDWMEQEGWANETLAQRLKISDRAVSSMRNNGDYHGMDAITKLANLMGRDPADLYLPPEAST
jgi:hypothetical protein